MQVRLLIEVDMFSVSPIMDWKKKKAIFFDIKRTHFLFNEVLTQ